MIRVAVVSLLGLALTSSSALAQFSVDELRKKGAQVGLEESPGPIPVFYVASTKDRALAFQKSLTRGFEWYAKQLNVSVPAALFVLDGPARSALGVPDGARSYTTQRPATIFLDEGRPLGAIPAPIPGADPLHDQGGLLVNEPILFHEAGHVFARALSLPSDSSTFLAELIANLFQVAYMRAERRDLDYSLTNIRTGRVTDAIVPRYSSWADFEYLGNLTTVLPSLRQDRNWFQSQLQHIADNLLNHRSLPDLVAGFQKEFPAGVTTSIAPEDVGALLKRVSPGFEPAASIFGPTTIPPATVSSCERTKPPGGTSLIVIRNDTTAAITVTPVNLSVPAVTVEPRRWMTSRVLGGTWKLPDGSCVTVRDEPSIAVVR